MGAPISTLHVDVEYSTEDKELGPVYVASFQEIVATTDGETMDKVVKNIREVVDLYLETQNDKYQCRLAKDVRVLITMEVPRFAATA